MTQVQRSEGTALATSLAWGESQVQSERGRKSTKMGRAGTGEGGGHS